MTYDFISLQNTPKSGVWVTSVPLQVTEEREKAEKQSSMKALCLYYEIYVCDLQKWFLKTPSKGDPRPMGCLLFSSTNEGKD